MRYFFEISYNGKQYHGWQSQANAVGVQAVVEEVFEKLFRKKIDIVGSGRTDTGVHCVRQYFHADFDHELDYPITLQKLNSFLPKTIAINSIHKVKPDAHARYSATERAYEYRITKVKNPFYQDYAYHFFKEVNVKTMNEAAALLLGEHDFQCFSKVKTDVNHFICDLKKARWNQKGDLLVFTIAANRFLRGMVRAIVGSLLDVGTGKTSIMDFQRIIKSKDRKKAGMNVPPDGLYLVDVKYPKSIFLD
ncbi:MAG TPA: tRNA pseudouridine(38-40) synthase TruA [Cytophagales bacterium]|nr:tRNA pseudouridine(38-40) synthase TruA [Cytophagales bacterium]